MRSSRRIDAGGVKIGGGEAVVIQSMCSTDTRDAGATLAQIGALHEAGCALVRLAVPDMAAAEALRRIVKESPLPVVADIHFDVRLALAALEAGVHKLRINPGNIGGADNVRRLAAACRERGVPIRIGVNGGSVKSALKDEYGMVEAMVRSAINELAILEDMGFRDVCLSLKASNVPDTIAANRLMAARCDCPLHLGVTEAGTSYHGLIKNAMGVGALLCDGIGDTIRVTLTTDPVEEIRAAKGILRAAGRLQEGVELISCPTCGRCRIGVERLALELEERLAYVKTPLKVAVMGCGVNGPGEAREADIGVAGGDGCGLLFRGGEIVRKLREDEIVPVLLAEIEMMLEGESG